MRNITPKAVAKDHQTKGVAANSARAVLIITPKLAVLGSTPTPTYDKTASANTKLENCITVLMSTKCMRLGTMWRHKTRGVETPNARADWMYSSSRNLRVSPRTKRHKPVKEVMPRMRHKKNNLASARSNAVSKTPWFLSMKTCSKSTDAAINNTSGIDASKVYTYWMASSTQPRK